MALFMGGNQHVPPWLLKSLLTCLDENLELDKMDFSAITVEREVTAPDGNRIDIVIRHDAFILGIENKVYAATYNPFNSYTSLLDTYVDNNQLIYQCILMPACNRAAGYTGWKRITYSELVNTSLARLGVEILNQPLSKWQVIYQEFLSHLHLLGENKMSNILDDEQAGFALKNFNSLLKAKHILEKLERTLHDDALRVVATVLPDTNIVKSVNNWKSDYKVLNLRHLTLVYRPSEEKDTEIEFYVNGIINQSEVDDLPSLENKIMGLIEKNEFIQSAENEDYELSISKNGRELTLSFWGLKKDKESAHLLLNDMTIWINNQLHAGNESVK